MSDDAMQRMLDLLKTPPKKPGSPAPVVDVAAPKTAILAVEPQMVTHEPKSESTRQPPAVVDVAVKKTPKVGRPRTMPERPLTPSERTMRWRAKKKSAITG